MYDFKLNDEDMQTLKMSLFAFVVRVAAGVGSSPEEVQILPEVISLLLGYSVMFDDCNCRAERVSP